MNRTKIVATLGPASDTRVKIEAMIRAGLNVARLNFSHGTHEHHAKLISRVRVAAKKLGQPVAILADLQGPRLRLGELPAAGIVVRAGETITLDLAAKKVNQKILPLNCPGLRSWQGVKKGERALIADGQFRAEIITVSGRAITIKMAVGGTLRSHKGLNFPDSSLKINPITSKDREDLNFVLKQGVDLVALSFVADSRPVLQIKKLIKQRLGELAVQPLVVVKIEKPSAVADFKNILEAADAVMIARGDLALEAGEERVPIIQKELIPRCIAAGKPVIVATQMLESMIENQLPTRAEASDVANAVIDHTDAVMLSGETASGDYPVEVIKEMNKIIAEAEKSRFDDVASAECAYCANQGAKVILTHTVSGRAGRLLSSWRCEIPLFVSTESELIARQLNLSWGVRPLVISGAKSLEVWFKKIVTLLKKRRDLPSSFVKEKLATKGLGLKKNDRVLILAADPWGQAEEPNLVEVRRIT